MKTTNKRFIIIGLLCIFAMLTACSNQEEESEKGKVAKETTVNAEPEEEMDESKEYLLQEIQQLTDKIKQSERGSEFGGYLPVEEYNTYYSRLNLLAKAIGVEPLVNENTKEKITGMISDLKEEAKSLSKEEARKAEKKMKEDSFTYKYIFMFDIHFAFDDLDIRSEYNQFNRFVMGSLETEEKTEGAAEALRDLEVFSSQYIKAMENNIEYFSDNFTDENLASLQLIVENFKKTIERQKSMLEDFSKDLLGPTIKDSEPLDKMMEPVDEAKKEVKKLEKDLGVQDFNPNKELAH